MHKVTKRLSWLNGTILHLDSSLFPTLMGFVKVSVIQPPPDNVATFTLRKNNPFHYGTWWFHKTLVRGKSKSGQFLYLIQRDFFFKLGYSFFFFFFTMLCWFLLHNEVTLLYVYVYISPPSWTSLPLQASISVATEHWAEPPALYGRFPRAISHIVVYIYVYTYIYIYGIYIGIYTYMYILYIYSPLPPHHVHISIIYVTSPFLSCWYVPFF